MHISLQDSSQVTERVERCHGGTSPLFFNGLGSPQRSQATGVPLFKKGKKEGPGNYRPVSLTSVPGEIMVKVILGITEKHLRDNTVIGHWQHGVHMGKVLLKQLNFLL